MWSRAKKADHYNLLHVRQSGGFNYVARSINVNALISLPVDLTIYSGAMRDRIAFRECAGEFGGIVEPDLTIARSGKLLNGQIGAVMAPGDERYLVSVGRERARDIAAHESCASGDGDFHGCPPFHAAQA
jgi:hypothetical protein